MSGSGLTPIAEAIDAMRAGRSLVIVDDEDRENEGDLVVAAEHATPAAINFMATHGRGLICLAMRGALLDRLQIPLMVPDGQNRSGYGTGFTVSIEAASGVTTGISAADRAHTIATLIDPASTPADIAMPGHVFPLRARDGGVLERRGQTEASVDLARLAGLVPAAVICEVMREDGEMMRFAELCDFARRHALPIVSVEQLARHRREREGGAHVAAPADSAGGGRRPASTLDEAGPDAFDAGVAAPRGRTAGADGDAVGGAQRALARPTNPTIATNAGTGDGAYEPVASDDARHRRATSPATRADTAGPSGTAGAAPRPELVALVGRSHLPTEHGEFDIHVFRDAQGFEHSALTCGDPTAGDEPPLVRLHSECLTGDAFGSRRCDCGPQLHSAMRRVAEAGRGAILYLRQEGRGIGLGNKIRAYELQDRGRDTVDANHDLGFPADARRYDVAAAMLDVLGIGSVRLMSNNPEKRRALVALGIDVTEALPIVIAPQSQNVGYLRTKVERMGHEIALGGEVPDGERKTPIGKASSRVADDGDGGSGGGAAAAAAPARRASAVRRLVPDDGA